MDIVKLVAQKRHEAGKGVARRLRRAGQLPAVIYGNGATVAITLPTKDMGLLQRSSANENTILELAIEGETLENCRAIVREVHVDPASRALLHVDLYRVDMMKPITVMVALHFVNEPVDRLRLANAALTHVHREVQVNCLPGDIPEYLPVDLVDLQLGTPFKAADLTLPAGVSLLTDVDEILVTAHVESSAEEDSEAEAEAEAEEQ